MNKFLDWFWARATKSEVAAVVVEPPKPPEPPKPAVEKKPRKPRKPKEVKPESVQPTEKELATARGEPWVQVTGFQIDMDSPSNGNMTLDWNDIFIAKLIRAGYLGRTDADLVDQWFNSICRNVLAENYEQYVSDPTNRR